MFNKDIYAALSPVHDPDAILNYSNIDHVHGPAVEIPCSNQRLRRSVGLRRDHA